MRRIFLLCSLISLAATFTSTPALAQSSSSFASLNKKPNGGYYNAIDDKLRYWFEEEYYVGNEATLNYKLFDQLNNVVQNPSSLPVKYGYNEYELDVTGLAAGYYLLEVANAKDEKWYLRFKVN